MLELPELPYRPRDPVRFRPPIGLIGCGTITGAHLEAYRNGGYDVVGLCDVDLEAARSRQREYYPDAELYENAAELLARDDIEVVDVATHPPVRVPQVEAALQAGKHVLSQKPFCVDLDEGERLCDLAAARGLKLAVNQNGRWAPHWSWTRHAIAAGLVGDVESVDLAVCWDHNWVVGTAFDDTEHLLVLDFGIHWFDIVTCFFGSRDAKRVTASVATSANQASKQPLLGEAVVEYDGGRATVVFNGSSRDLCLDTTTVIGSEGAVHCTGPDLRHQRATLVRDGHEISPRLTGEWFPDGMHGAMAELLCAIEEDREPTNSARDHLRSLALCFAACRSSVSQTPQAPGAVRRLG